MQTKTKKRKPTTRIEGHELLQNAAFHLVADCPGARYPGQQFQPERDAIRVIMALHQVCLIGKKETCKS